MLCEFCCLHNRCELTKKEIKFGRKDKKICEMIPKNYTKKDYVDQLQMNDKLACAAAGFMIWYVKNNKVNLLAIKENRHGSIKLNFVGGRRNYFQEMPWQIAKRECGEELGTNNQLSKYIDKLHEFKKGAWFHKSRYVLFSLKINEEIAHDVLLKHKENDIIPVIIEEDKLIEIDWHPYAWRMIQCFQTK